MARYAQLYEDSQKALRKVQKRLADAEHYKEIYCAFIKEAGHAEAFLLWYAKRLDLELDCLKKPESSSEGGKE